MTVKMFEWPEDQGTELTVQSVVGINVEEMENDARERQLGLARAEELAAQAGAGIALLRELAEAMAGHKEDDVPQTFATDHLDDASRVLLSEVLGKGEVSGQVLEPSPVMIQESVFPGLWRVKSASDQGVPECLVIADVPHMMRVVGKSLSDPDMRIKSDGTDVMNALPVLTEIRDRAQAYEPNGRENHVINFTLLPMSEGDMVLMRDTLGVGHVDLKSKGYGACRVFATRWPHVWSVQFFNAMDNIILDTLEIGDVPVSVRAAGDDFADSAQRIHEIIEAYL